MSEAIDPGLAVGRVDLSVADLDRSQPFYEQEIGLVTLERTDDTATLGAGGVPLLKLHQLPGARHMQRATGLYHFALRVPTRRDLARVLARFIERRTPLDGASDHLVSEALYLSDPDGHGIEVYRDRPRSAWYDKNGKFQMDTLRLDAEGIIGELQPDEPAWNGLPAGTDMGHIHLQVADIGAAERFYLGVLGLDRMASMPSASFVSAGGYHHHIGMNTWAGRGVPPPPDNAARLLAYELVVPTDTALSPLLDRVRAANLQIGEGERGWEVRDPSHNLVVLRVA